MKLKSQSEHCEVELKNTDKTKDAMGNDHKIGLFQLQRETTAREILGIPGRILSPSKSLGPATAIWNARIIDVDKNLLWNGDIDVEQSRDQLLQLAKELGPIYILREFDTRLDEALVRILLDKMWIDDNFAKYMRLKEQRLKKTTGKG